MKGKKIADVTEKFNLHESFIVKLSKIMNDQRHATPQKQNFCKGLKRYVRRLQELKSKAFWREG